MRRWIIDQAMADPPAISAAMVTVGSDGVTRVRSIGAEGALAELTHQGLRRAIERMDATMQRAGQAAAMIRKL